MFRFYDTSYLKSICRPLWGRGKQQLGRFGKQSLSQQMGAEAREVEAEAAGVCFLPPRASRGFHLWASLLHLPEKGTKGLRGPLGFSITPLHNLCASRCPTMLSCFAGVPDSSAQSSQGASVHILGNERDCTSTLTWFGGDETQLFYRYHGETGF